MESEANRTLLLSAIRGDEVLFPYELMYSDCPGETAGSMHIKACKDCAEERPGSTHTNVCCDFPGATVGETYTNVHIDCHRERAQIIGTNAVYMLLAANKVSIKRTE